MTRIACFGGIYNNYLALEAAIADARQRGVDGMYCMGDLGAFGPYPGRVFPLLHENGVICMQGNYDNSIGNELDNCQCGYTDPRDNYFAQVSYHYTLQNTSAENRHWLRGLPGEIRLELGGLRALMCHGSPRRMNEFLWESTTPTHFLDQLADQHEADVILATHTGIKWQRELSRDRRFINVGVLGRPENDGQTHVWYTLLEQRVGGTCNVEFIPLAYDYERLAREMADEKLPQEFVETILTGWWTTCLEILPSKERRRGKW
jgi:predicted phosphodiesterase